MLLGLLRQRVAVFAGVGLVLILLVWFGRGEKDASDFPPAWARIDRMEKKRDVAGLTQAVSDPDPSVATRALSALGRVSPGAAREAAEKAAAEPNWQLREAAATVLGAVGDRQKVDVLNNLLAKDPNAMVRASAASSLGVLRSWDGLQMLIPALDDPNRPVRSSAHVAIHRILGLDFSYALDGSASEHQAAMQRIRQLLPSARPLYDDYMQRFNAKEK